MRAIAANAMMLLIVAAVIVAGVVGWGAQRYRAPGPFTQATEFSVARGASINAVSAALEEQGLIDDARIFRIGARYEGRARDIRYGEYEVPAGASMAEILALLASGRTIQYSITLPEGLTSFQMVERLRGEERLSGEIDAIPPEGSLAPDTYFFGKGEARATIIERMTAAQETRLAEAWAARAPNLPAQTPQEALILASVIEKETGLPEERRLVAAAFTNRLRRGMKLQSDPTIVYGLTEGKGPLGRGIRRSEIVKPSDWNTYVIDGLPKTPICNPGLESIRAALDPADSPVVFFVADGTGGHAFAETLEQHNRNVAQWRRIERERAAQQN